MTGIMAELHESVEWNVRPRALVLIIKELEKSGVMKLLIQMTMDQRD